MGKRDASKERFWRETIARQADSGLSVRVFCHREQLAESNFYAWRRELRLRDAEGSKPSRTSRAQAKPPFIPVIVNDAPRTDESITLTLASGHVLRLPTTYEPEPLARLLVALAAKESP